MHKPQEAQEAHVYVGGCGRFFHAYPGQSPFLTHADVEHNCTERDKQGFPRLAGVRSADEAQKRCRTCPQCGYVAERHKADEAPEPAPATPDPAPPPSPASADDMPQWMRDMLAPQQPPPTPELPLTPESPAPEPEQRTELQAGAVPAAPAPPDPFAEGPLQLAPFHTLLPKDVETGPSVLGNSTLRPFKLCWRMGYYQTIKGLRRYRKIEDTYTSARGYVYNKFDPLALGTLVHVLLALFYKGVESIWAVLEPIKPHYPKLCAEAERLVTNYLNKWAERDRNAFDVRFVELESRLYYKKKRVKAARKNLSLCVSSRHDLGYRDLRPGESRLPPGVAAERGIKICDHKTSGAVTEDSKTSYRHDPQVLQNAASYMHGNSILEDGTLGAPSAARFGPMTHFIVNIIGKAQDHDPDKHLVRVAHIVPDDVLTGFVDDTRNWLYGELAERLFSPAWYDEDTWEKSYLCRDPATGKTCVFMEICERGGLRRFNPAESYVVNPRGPYDPERLLAPEKPKKTRKKKAACAVEVEAK